MISMQRRDLVFGSVAATGCIKWPSQVHMHIVQPGQCLLQINRAADLKESFPLLHIPQPLVSLLSLATAEHLVLLP